MACMTHRCLDCDHLFCSNYVDDRCPMCGSRRTVGTFDESHGPIQPITAFPDEEPPDEPSD